MMILLTNSFRALQNDGCFTCPLRRVDGETLDASCDLDEAHRTVATTLGTPAMPEWCPLDPLTDASVARAAEALLRDHAGRPLRRQERGICVPGQLGDDFARDWQTIGHSLAAVAPDVALVLLGAARSVIENHRPLVEHVGEVVDGEQPLVVFAPVAAADGRADPEAE